MVARVLDDPSREPLLRRLHANTGVEYRHLALPLDEYAGLTDFGTANERFLEVGLDLAEDAVTSALKQAGLEASDVDLIVSTTITGITVPSIEARLARRIGLREDIRRVPLFGLGCVAGVAGLSRVHDFVRTDPDAVAVLLSVELCSLTVQHNDTSTANLVASGLFGDAATAVVVVGDRRARELGPGADTATIVATRSHLYPDTERIMGWDVSGTGLKIVLDPRVPELAREYLPADVAGLLDSYALTTADVTAWVCHPGGPKIIDAIEESLSLPESALELTRRGLAEVGNLSSSSVLRVLRDTFDKHPPAGTPGVMIAMGPGFCAELLLLEWGA
jgi:alkylresorcinol/alkylpyrone synthase